MSKKIFAMFLAVLMVISLLPTVAMAAPKCPGKSNSHTVNNCDATAGKVVAPVCSIPGYTYYTCDVCGVEFRDSYVAATGEHDYKPDPATAVAPTCGEPGNEAGMSCTVCGDVKAGKKLPALFEEGKTDCKYLPSVKIDCLVGGIQILKCINCGHEQAPFVVRAKEFHTWSIGPVVVKEATATENAVAAFYCECGASQEATVYDNHKCKDFAVKVEYPATCTENGMAAHYECRACGNWLYRNSNSKKDIITDAEKPYYIIPAEHNWADDVADIDPDVYKKNPDIKVADNSKYIGGFPCGTSKRYCVDCEEIISVTVKHSYDLDLMEYYFGGYGQDDPNGPIYSWYFGQWEVIAGMEQTCVTAGQYKSECENCGSLTVREFPALGHELVTVTVPATCGSYGYTFSYCVADECHVLVDGVAQENNPVDFGYVGELNEAVKYDVTVDTFVRHNDSVAPAVGAPFILGFWQNALGEYRYFNGAMDGKYLATTNNMEEAVEVYVENFNGESDKYLLYFLQANGKKTYIEMYNDLNDKGEFFAGVRLVNDAPRVNYFEYDTTFNTFKTRLWDKYTTIYFGSGEEVCPGETCDGCNDCTKQDYFLGTYGDYATISASSSYYFYADMDFEHEYNDCVVYGFEGTLDYEGTQYVAALGTIEKLPVKLVDIQETSGFNANNHNFTTLIAGSLDEEENNQFAPTCEKAGKLVFRCSEPGCAQTITVTLPKLEHNWTYTETFGPGDKNGQLHDGIPCCYKQEGTRVCADCGLEEDYNIPGKHILINHPKFITYRDGDHLGRADRYTLNCLACSGASTIQSSPWSKGTATFSALDYYELVSEGVFTFDDSIDELMMAAMAANYYHGNSLQITPEALENPAIWKQARRGDCNAVGLLSTTCNTPGCQYATVYIVRNDEFGATGEHVIPAGNAQTAPVKVKLTNSLSIYAVDIVAPLTVLKAGYKLNVTAKLADGQELALYKVNDASVLEAVNLVPVKNGNVYTYEIAVEGIYAINVNGIEEPIELKYTLELPVYEEPTCEDEGYVFGYECVRCENVIGKNVNAAEKLPAYGHYFYPNMGNIGYDEYEAGECGDPNTYEPTGVCLYCGEYFWEASAPDDRARYGVTSVWGANKCEDLSYKLYFCNACEELHIFSMYGEFGHDFHYVRTADTEGTCYDPAYDIYKCSGCGEEKNVYGEIVPHVNAAGEKFYEKCTDTVTDRHCVVCHDELDCGGKGEGHKCADEIDEKTLEYLCPCMISTDHNIDIDLDNIDPDDWTEASCTMPKHIVVECPDCDFVFYQEEGTAKGHTPMMKDGNGSANFVYPDDSFVRGLYHGIPEMYEYVAPTRAADGYGKFFCVECQADVTQVYPRIEGIAVELNAANANGRDDLAVGSLIALTISINGFDQEVYGLDMVIPFFAGNQVGDEYMPSVIYVGYEVLNEDFVLAVTKAGMDEASDPDVDGNVYNTIKVAGYAANNILSGKRQNVVINEKTDLVTLYFRVLAPFAYDELNETPGYIFNATAEADKLDDLGKPEAIDTVCEPAEIEEIVAFGNVDGDDHGDFHITDLYAAMGMLTGEFAGGKDYSAAVDFDKDGEFTLLDLANMYQAYVGSFDAIDILLAGVSDEEAEFLMEVLADQILECQSRKCDAKFDQEYEFCPVCGWPQEWD